MRRVDRTEGLKPAVSLWDARPARWGLGAAAGLRGDALDLFTFTETERQTTLITQ